MSSSTTATTVPEPIYHELYYPRPTSSTAPAKPVIPVTEELCKSDFIESITPGTSSGDIFVHKDEVPLREEADAAQANLYKEGQQLYPEETALFKQENYVQYSATAQFSTLHSNEKDSQYDDPTQVEGSLTITSPVQPSSDLYQLEGSLAVGGNESGSVSGGTFRPHSFSPIFCPSGLSRSLGFDDNASHFREVEVASCSSHDETFTGNPFHCQSWSSNDKQGHTYKSTAFIKTEEPRKIDEVYRRWSTMEETGSQCLNNNESNFLPAIENSSDDCFSPASVKPHLSLNSFVHIPKDPEKIDQNQSISCVPSSQEFVSTQALDATKFGKEQCEWTDLGHSPSISLHNVPATTFVHAAQDEFMARMISQDSVVMRPSIPFDSSQNSSLNENDGTSDFNDLRASLLSARDEARKSGSRVEEDFLEEWMRCLTGEESKPVFSEDGIVCDNFRSSLACKCTSVPGNKPQLCSCDRLSVNKNFQYSQRNTTFNREASCSRKFIQFSNENGDNAGSLEFKRSIEALHGDATDRRQKFYGQEALDLAAAQRDPQLAAIVNQGWLGHPQQIIPPKRGAKKRRSSEKRKEKSREAARCRRSKESELYSALSDCLPLPRDVLDNLDKASIMRLAIACLHTGDMLHASFGSSSYSSSPPEDERLKDVCGQYQDAILQAVDGFVLALSCSGDVAYVSASIARYLGLPQVDVMGISLYDLVHQCDHQDLQQLLAIPSASKTSSSGPQLKMGGGDGGRSATDGSLAKDGSCDGERHLWEPRHGFLRMKCTLASKGRNVTIRNASYKVVEISGKLVYRQSSGRGVAALGWLMCMASPVPHPANIEVPLDRQTFFSKHSLDMKFLYADENFPQFCGFTPSQLEGQSLFELHHEQDGNQLRQAFLTLRTKGQVNTGRYRFLVLGGGYVWIVTQATVISGQRESAPAAIVCLHYVISGVEQPGLVLSCVQLLPRLCSSPRAPPPALEGAGADGASTGAADGVLAMTVTAVPNTNSPPTSSHSSGKLPLKLVARSNCVLTKPAASPYLIPNSGPQTPNLDNPIVSDAPSLISLGSSFRTDQETSETAPYLASLTSLTNDTFPYEGPRPSYQSPAAAVGEPLSNSTLCSAQSSANTEGSFFGISLNVNVTSEFDSSNLRLTPLQSEISSANSPVTHPGAPTPSYGQAAIVSTPLLERETGSSPLLSQSAAGVFEVKSFAKTSFKEENSTCAKKESPDSLLTAEPLNLEQYLFPDSSCDSASLGLFDDIQPQNSEHSFDESMDFMGSSPFLKTEEFFEGECIEGCAPLLPLSEDERLIMWSPGTEERSSSSSSSSSNSSGSNNSSLSSSPCKRNMDSCDGVFSPDSGFDGGLYTSADERGFGSGGRRVDCSHRDSPRRSSFSELLQLSSSPLKGSGDAPASCIDPNTVWPGLLRSQPPQGDKPLDFEQLLQEDDEEEPSSSPTLASVLLREDPCGTPHSSCPSSSNIEQTTAVMHTHESPKPPRREFKTRPFTVPLDSPAVSTTRLLTPSAQKTIEEPPLPTNKRPSSPYETRQFATRKRVCAAPTSDESSASSNVPFKSSRPLIKPNMPCVEQLLVSKCVPDKNAEGGLYNNKNQSHSVLRNLLVSGHDSSKEHYVLPLSPSPSRDRSPQSLSKCSSADSDSADDPPDTSSPPPRAVSPLRLTTRSFRSSRHSKASILVEAVSSSAAEEDTKCNDNPESPTLTSPTLVLHSNSIGRMKLLRFAPAHRSVYATRGANGRLQLLTQRASAKVAQSVVLEDCATTQSLKSNPVLVKPASAVTAPYALHFCSDAPSDCAQVVKLKGYGDCASKKVLFKRRANKDMTSATETPRKRQLLIAREATSSTPISWLSLSPSDRWTATGDHHTLLQEPSAKTRIAKPRIGERVGADEVFTSNGQNQHSECLYMEDSDSPSVTIVPIL